MLELVEQHSMKEIIKCLLSSNYKNTEIKKIIDFIVEEEGKLKIIQILLHLSENILQKKENFQPKKIVDQFKKKWMKKKRKYP